MESRIRGEGLEQIEISRKEVRKAIGRMKRGKAAGGDEIEGKCLKFGCEAVKEEVVNRV